MEIEVTTGNTTSASPGQNLKQARQSADMSEQQVAEYLKITVNYIRALEADEYHKLPATPYVVGYLRAYSRLVSVDTDALLQDFQKCQGQERHDESSGSEDRNVSKKTWVKGLLVVLAVILAWGLAVWLFDDGEGASTVESPETLIEQEGGALLMPSPGLIENTDEENIDNAVESSEQKPVEKEAVEAEVTVEPSTEATSGNRETDAEIQAEEALAKPVAEATKLVAVGTEEIAMDTLVLNFSDECWLEITDANGDVLAADLYQAGDTFEAAGKAPFAIMVGNVRATEVLFNGAPHILKANGFRKTLRAVIE